MKQFEKEIFIGRQEINSKKSLHRRMEREFIRIIEERHRCLAVPRLATQQQSWNGLRWAYRGRRELSPSEMLLPFRRKMEDVFVVQNFINLIGKSRDQSDDKTFGLAGIIAAISLFRFSSTFAGKSAISSRMISLWPSMVPLANSRSNPESRDIKGPWSTRASF